MINNDKGFSWLWCQVVPGPIDPIRIMRKMQNPGCPGVWGTLIIVKRFDKNKILR